LLTLIVTQQEESGGSESESGSESDSEGEHSSGNSAEDGADPLEVKAAKKVNGAATNTFNAFV
jgi:hypothetical protein